MEPGKRIRTENAWFQPTFDVEKKKTNKQTIAKKRKVEKNATHNVYKDDSNDWCKQFCPKDLKELAVNDKKVLEVENWLKKALNELNPISKILLLTGPPGCGKTACVKILAQNLKAQLSEWITPIDIDYYHVNSYNDEVCSYQERQSDKFSDFLLKASRYPSLLSQNNNSRRIILVEDFPNIFIKNPKEFTQILEKYFDKGRSPLVFVCADSKQSALNIQRNLFPSDILAKFNIHQISFNAVTNTQMKAALKRVISSLGKNNPSYTIPDLNNLDGIVNSSMGDIRSAFNNLYIVMVKGTIPLSTQNKATKSVKNKTKVVNKMDQIGKDENITLLHAVGRVLNPKRTEDKLSFTHSPMDITEQFQSEPNTFVGLLFENYLPHFSKIEHIEKAAEALSDADCFAGEWRDNYSKIYSLYTATAELMIANETPVSHWHPITGFKHNQVKHTLSTKDIPHLRNSNILSSKVLAIDYKPYCDLITYVQEEVVPESDEEIPVIEEWDD